ncbi:peptide ligase PGM1-related protein [Streptomyces sp. NBC_01218]|uniref:peptide ligase PGM1-related protein n=1 Tax=unclassified Streptomyces TaxID=2593676 RepID=UPI0023B88803|nr:MULTISPECIES: peptide ligase PGM1-related protein [unclassified Streptomyces]WEH38224.1 peptide ligase PGM1-related protein [Streptomyces sp. AM 2-1-1]WSQ49885.1 peptide ligase PGM1-related protein [Streptomyces sp. NBC_01218]
MTDTHRRPTARIHIESRECGPEVLERLTGATYFPERLLGPSIVTTVCRAGGHLLYVTAPSVIDGEEQVDYYLGLLLGGARAADPERLRRMRALVRVLPLDDASTRWLSTKVLDPVNPRAAEVRSQLREFVQVHRSAGADVRLSYFEPSEPLEELARELGVPGTQPSSAHIPLGTKHTGRQIFGAAGIAVPRGSGVCHDLGALASAVAALARSGLRRLVLKLDSTAFGGGLGNALLTLDDDIASPDGPGVEERVARALPGATLMDPKLTWHEYVTLMKDDGVIVEEMITDVPLHSPSFQGRLTERGTVEAVSTHDQVFGDDGQSYHGCSFPADAAYRRQLIEQGLRVGEVLRERGVGSGDYGVDFLATREGDGWRLLGCEINLRATATKHPFTMAVGLLGQGPTPDGRFEVDGAEYVYQASDVIMDRRYEGLRPARLIEAVTASPIGYDPVRRTGVVLHLLSPVTEFGKFGALCIGRSHAQASALMRDVRALADRLAEKG